MHDHKGKKNPKWRHGFCGTKFYLVWKHIRSKIYNKSSKDYFYYGGRGIKTEWNNFAKFKIDMFQSYKEGLTIERIDNNGNYTKENCRWATRAEQSRNTRRTRLITFNGKTQCLVDWAKELRIKRATLSNRLNYYNWSIEKALTTKVK